MYGVRLPSPDAAFLRSCNLDREPPPEFPPLRPLLVLKRPSDIVEMAVVVWLLGDLLAEPAGHVGGDQA